LCAGDDLVTEAGGHHQVGLDDLVAQQPGRADLAAELFVVSEQQFHTAMGGFGHGFKRTHREGVGGKVGLAHGGGPTIQLAVFNVAAIGVVRSSPRRAAPHRRGR